MSSVRPPLSRLVLVLLVGSLLAAKARPVKIWSDGELAKQSKLVIVATVVEVNPTNRLRTLEVDNFAPLPLKIHRATLKIDRVLKGTAGDTIALEFGQVDGGFPPMVRAGSTSRRASNTDFISGNPRIAPTGTPPSSRTTTATSR